MKHRLFFLLLNVFCLSACGQTGNLYLPEKPPTTTTVPANPLPPFEPAEVPPS
ncbi:MAG TPA: lipoprotein [Gammaproteobacteria bacterium]|jgi:predicted small lipoprotein YifL|nr:lipoprotein [Gammaproteobacteria bacterium]